MQTRTLLNSLRVLIAAGSVGGFLGGWALLAHSGKPVAAQPPAAQVAPAPLRPQDLLNQAPSQSSKDDPLGLQPLQPLPPMQSLQPLPSTSSFGFPSLRTGGS
jgi:hypothetical protein